MPTSIQENNKRIAKNTLMLYFRMFFLMLVGLYTSRVVLNALGVEDYGIYNVVGGVVAMMSFVTNSIGTATQRFLNYEMGKGNTESLSKVFSTSFISYCLLIILVLLMAELIGVWFVENKLVIPDGRRDIAFWVFQLSLLTFVVGMLAAPYNAAIIAHERMGAFAYISIVEALGKLAIAYLITVSPIDRLLIYAILMCCVSLLVRFLYTAYCKRRFPECKLRWVWDVPLMKRLFSFSGWMLAGTVTLVFQTQGINMLINIFFGPVCNAARGIAVHVQHTVRNFVTNFMIAVRPQIIKSYAQGDKEHTYNLIFSSSKISFYLLFVLSITLLLETQYILTLWLKNPPEEATIFTQLVLLDLFITTAYAPIASVSQASGKVKVFQLTISIFFMLAFGMTWVVYHFGGGAYMAFVVIFVVDIVGLFARLIVLKRIENFPAMRYLKKVMLPILVVFAVSLVPCLAVSYILSAQTIANLAVKFVAYVLCSGAIAYFLGLSHNEKEMVRKLVSSRLKHKDK